MNACSEKKELTWNTQQVISCLFEKLKSGRQRVVEIFDANPQYLKIQGLNTSVLMFRRIQFQRLKRARDTF